ncbi:uncharacterized protein PHALS_04530 [Plasmopara halstedii]|uniref:Uncharacterized protein n=1 Tax=Plasmopara halstedii TaxID=4781 RepID=A0A0P1A9Z9_PLAHL|nr:uncharacterized protein PHALS_04530 [Plasmopara halstedii]CEG37069.1 hypothetical protein PHALS_04530 [Plasmopara halstedii]|eukprot:XP_024573438.1 hypothetical protein PHALS_04530 [Plasmopara halstedii]
MVAILNRLKSTAMLVRGSYYASFTRTQSKISAAKSLHRHFLKPKIIESSALGAAAFENTRTVHYGCFLRTGCYRRFPKPLTLVSVSGRFGHNRSSQAPAVLNLKKTAAAATDPGPTIRKVNFSHQQEARCDERHFFKWLRA